jgi:hypothetical protein
MKVFENAGDFPKSPFILQKGKRLLSLSKKEAGRDFRELFPTVNRHECLNKDFLAT